YSPDHPTHKQEHTVSVGERAIDKQDASGAEADRRHAHTKPHLQLERVVPVLPAEKGLFRLPGALEYLFRERRAVVGAMWLVANQRELTVEASVTERLGRTQARQRGAHDGDAAQHGSPSLFD